MHPTLAAAPGDSAYNAAELAACGFHAPGVLPIIVDPDKWNIAPDAALMARLQDGRTNAEIATELSIGVETVRTHARNIYRKLGIKTRRDLAKFARHPRPLQVTSTLADRGPRTDSSVMRAPRGAKNPRIRTTGNGRR